MKENIHEFSYDRSKVKAGILHIGVGNFHRAHLEYLTNLLLENEDQSEWAISGAMLLKQDEKLYRALKSQDQQYTLTVCGRKGGTEVYQIGALKELNWAIEEAETILEKIASKDIRIITMTITEGGYNTEKSTGRFMTENEDVAFDIAHPKEPKTVFGFVTEGLRRRRDAGAGPITILSCDNLQHNGNTAKRSFMSFAKAQDPEIEKWMSDNVTFPNSMVDRITPATKPEDIERLNAENGTNDACPVYCEDFIQWVVEDNFAAGRPEWERVGCEMTDDVTLFENMKLSLLNASHTLLSYPSFLAGYRKVDKAMGDERITTLVRQFMDIDITPYVPEPPHTSLTEYKQTLVERFANPIVSDQVARLCFDGVSKFPVYVMPNLGQMIRDGKDLTRPAYLIACYRSYLKYGVDDKGQKFTFDEPWITEEDLQILKDGSELNFLKLSPFASVNLLSDAKFVSSYLDMVKRLEEKGAMGLLEEIL